MRRPWRGSRSPRRPWRSASRSASSGSGAWNGSPGGISKRFREILKCFQRVSGRSACAEELSEARKSEEGRVAGLRRDLALLREERNEVKVSFEVEERRWKAILLTLQDDEVARDVGYDMQAAVGRVD